MATTTEFSARASLVLFGQHFQQLGIWSVIRTHVQIKQKVRQHTPLDKLLDCFINILAGGSGLVEVNTRVRPDRALQCAFGRSACAEQSTISDTLDACTPANVQQLQTAVTQLLRQHGQSYRHDYAQQWQLLDLDITGLPAGLQGEGVTKGYFAHQRNRRGRQLGRVLATRYDEIVLDRLLEGTRQLETSLPTLVTAAEQALELTATRRQRTILRIDGGGGTDANIDWLLARGYQLVVKVKNGQRSRKLAASVTHWYPDPTVPEREVGWVEAPHAYGQPTRQVALRVHQAKDKWRYRSVVFTRTDEMLFQLTGQPRPAAPTATEILFAALHAYDQRGGGIETQNKGDKQGLGLAHRNKHRFAAQEMLVLLAQLAHNLVIWTRNALARADGHLKGYGIQRTVRDAFQIPGCVQINAQGQIEAVSLNPAHPLTAVFQRTASTWHQVDNW